MTARLRPFDTDPEQPFDVGLVFSGLSLSPLKRLELAAELRILAEKVILSDRGMVEKPPYAGLSAAERFQFGRIMMHTARFLDQLAICSRASEVVVLIRDFQRCDAEDC